MNNFLSAEPLLMARIKDKAGLSNVFSTIDLQGVTEKSQVVPAVHVIFDGYKPVSKAGNPDVIKLQQSWIIVVVVRNVSATHEASAVNEDAGPYILNAIQSLQGYKLSNEHSAIEIVAAPAPLIRAGFGYYPIKITTNVITRGIN